MSNLNTSFDWRAEHVASRKSKYMYTYFLGETKFTKPPGKQRTDFRLSRDAMSNLNTSFDWRAEHVASRKSKYMYTYFLGETKFTWPPGKQRLDCRLSHD